MTLHARYDNDTDELAPNHRLRENTMEVSPAQRRQAKALWQRLTRRLPHSHLSTQDAFVTLSILNLPSAATKAVIQHQATLEAEAQWQAKLTTKLSSYLFGEGNGEGLEAYRNEVIGKRMYEFFHQSALTHRSLEGAWWTPVTASFVHLDSEHLLKNMAAFVGVAPVCAQVPGMSALHVFAIALGTSLFTSAATILRFSRFDLKAVASPMTCGFSAIVCAFTSVATLGSTGTEVQVLRSYRINVNSLWITMLGQIAYDFWGLVSQATELGPAWLGGVKKRNDCVSHLLGAVFGAAYYYAFLRRYKRATVSYREPRR